jgi:3-phosphoshikimate 1-carboxyvinyltransferase
LRDAPDLLPAVTIAALCARGPTRICDVRHARFKECDRIKVLARELRKLGAMLEEFEDGLGIVPGPLQPGPTLDPEDDHRMAMAFGVLSLRYPGSSVANPGCVSKSFPKFWDFLSTLRGN